MVATSDVNLKSTGVEDFSRPRCLRPKADLGNDIRSVKRTAKRLTAAAVRVEFSHHVGAVAQLGERSVRNAEVRGSIPLGSTFSAIADKP